MIVVGTLLEQLEKQGQLKVGLSSLRLWVASGARGETAFRSRRPMLLESELYGSAHEASDWCRDWFRGLIAIMGSPRKLGPKKHDAAVRQTGSQEEVLLGSQFSSWQRSVLKC